MNRLRVGIFPFGGLHNPYTTLIGRALDAAAVSWKPLFDTKWFPIQRAIRQDVDLLQMYWPSGLYKSSTRIGTMIKRGMFFDGLRRLGRFPFVYSVENLWPHDSDDDAYDREVTQRILDRVDGLIVMADGARDILSSTYRLPEGVVWGHVPHCNYVGWYPNEVSKNRAREALGLPKTAPVLLALGRIAKYKGLSALVDAFLEADVPGSVLLVAGRPQSDQVAGEVSESVRQLSVGKRCEVRLVARFVKDEEIQLFLNACDALAVSYSDVPMNPGSVVLAMSFGRCVLGPEKGVTSEVVGRESFFGYDEGTRESFVAAVQRVLTQGDLDVRGRVALDRAMRQHSPAIVASRFREFYERLREVRGRAA